jgi:hypothetical protein
MTVTGMGWYSFGGAGGSYATVIYSNYGNAPNTLLYDKTGFPYSGGGADTATGLSCNLIGGTEYWFGVLVSANVWIAGTDQSTSGSMIEHATYPTVPSTFSESISATATMSLYVNYTATSANYSPVFASTANYNATIAGHTSLFSISANDWTSIQGYIFSSNSTGTMTNSTYTALSGSSNSVTLNSTAVMPSLGKHIAVQWFAEGSDGSWGRSSVFTFASYAVPTGVNVVGNKIYTASGQLLILKGMVYTYFMDSEGGSWMMPSGTVNFLTNPMSTTGVTDLLTFMKASGCNVVRVFLTTQYWVTDSNSYISNLEYFITQAATYGIYVDICPWCNTVAISEPSTLPWEDGNTFLTTSTEFVNLWTNISTTLKSYPNVLFELWNEPQGTNAGDEATWFTVAQECINAIRVTGATQPIIIQWEMQINYDFYDGQSGQAGVVSSMSWAFAYPLSDPLGNLIYSQHLYAGTNNGDYTSTTYAMVTDYSDILYALGQCNVLAVAAVHPVFIGEVGDDLWDTTTTTGGKVYVNGVADTLEQDVWFNNTLTVLDQYGISYAGFAAPPWNSGGDDYGYVMSGEANYTLDSAGVILVNHMGGETYSAWLSG